METCSHCGADLPENATFCPSCGRRTDMPAPEPREEPIDVQHAEPQFFGLGSPVFVFGVMFVLLVAGIVLIVVGSLVLGVISIVLAACLLPAFLAGARRWPETRLARVGVSTAGRVRDEADVAAESISTWSKTGRDVVRLRKEQFRLRRERDAKIRELGVSVFEEDGRADELKASAKELDEPSPAQRARAATSDRGCASQDTKTPRSGRRDRDHPVGAGEGGEELDALDVRAARPAEHRPAVLADDEVACVLRVAVHLDRSRRRPGPGRTLEQRVTALGRNEEDMRLLVVY